MWCWLWFWIQMKQNVIYIHFFVLFFFVFGNYHTDFISVPVKKTISYHT